MGRETIELGSVPCDEDCAQVGQSDYAAKAMIECRAYKNQLLRAVAQKFGSVPQGLILSVRTQQHDFGNYYEIICRFDTNVPAQVDAAGWLEDDGPVTWDDEAKAEIAKSIT